MIGKVRTYSKQKKYGFILGDDGKMYFFHESEIKIPSRNLSEGYDVEFNILDGYPNPKAINVRLL